MKVWGQLERAQLENVAANPTGGNLTPEGRAWWNTVSDRMLISDGSALQTVLLGGNGQIVNADVNASAAIAYSKLNLAGSILNADVNSSAAIARSKLASGSGFRVVTNDTSGVMTDAAAITASRVLVSDANGIPTHATPTTTEINYVSGVTSSIQSQLNTLGGLNSTGQSFYNLGLTISGGTLTICGQDGTALSASNPGYVFIQHTTNHGQIVRLTMTANVTITNANFNGMLLGTTTGIGWSNRPFYLYASNLDNTNAGLAFFLSPTPSFSIASGSFSSFIGYKGSAPAISGNINSIFLLSSAPTGYDLVNCFVLGGILMSKDGSNNWTMSFGSFGSAKYSGLTLHPHERTLFEFPQGHGGAASNSYLYSSLGGTAPTWSGSETYYYSISMDGYIDVFYSTVGGGNNCTNGSGGQEIFLTSPLTFHSLVMTNCNHNVGHYDVASRSPAYGPLLGVGATSGQNQYIDLSYANGPNTNRFHNNEFGSSGDDLSVRGRFPIYYSNNL